VFIPSEDFGVNLVHNTPDGELHAKRNFELCRAIDTTKLGIVLADMVKTGHISKRQAENFDTLASSLLATILAENHRSFIGSPVQSTASTVRRYGVEATDLSTDPVSR
jgi:hypothetical protein